MSGPKVRARLSPGMEVHGPALDARPVPHVGWVTAGDLVRWRALSESWDRWDGLSAVEAAELLSNAAPALLRELESVSDSAAADRATLWRVAAILGTSR